MKKLLSLFVLATILLTLGFASAATKCGGDDLCTWTTTTFDGNPDLGLPLNSGPYGPCPTLTPAVSTYWPLGTQDVPSIATATCVFDGADLDLGTVMLFLSIDNDVISCTLNGNPVADIIQDSEGCAILDPMTPEEDRTGFVSSQLFATSGENTVVCVVEDRGMMAYFDACVVATEEVQAHCGNGILETGEACDDGNTADGDGCSANCIIEEQTPVVPEFGLIAGITTVLGALGTFFVLRRK